MSPTEFELRAALRYGEGDDDGPDADTIVRRAVDMRRQRRARIGGGLAAAAVVAGVAVTGGVLIGSDGGQRNDGSSSAAGGAADTKAASGNQAQGASRGASTPALTAPTNGYAADLAAACPSTAPRLMLPGGGGTGQFGGTDTLLANDVAAVVVCGYGATETPRSPTATTLSGAAARALAAGLNGAPAVHRGICPQFRTADTTQFVLVGVTADGARGAPVVVTLGANPCQSLATNGTAARYGWTPPESLAGAFPLASPGGSAPAPQHS